MLPLTTIKRTLVLGAASILSLSSPSSSGAGARSGSEAACAAYSLSGSALAHVQLNATTYYPANASISLTSPLDSLATSNLPAFCRLELEITTNATAGSVAKAEVWLPDEWNSRALTLGNGGYTGGVNYADLGFAAVKQGFAGMSTNAGHDSGAADGRWGGPHNDNAIKDFGYRALHLTVLVGKAIVAQYYQVPAKKSYYMGCSNGGNQGLKEVQEYPEDFDGVVVGSPANRFIHLSGWLLHLNQVSLVGSPRYISASQWSDVVAPEVMKQCDALDGLEDSIINDPRLCNFNADRLQCVEGQSTSCLSAYQVSALKQIFSDYYEGDKYVFGRVLPSGGEAALAQGVLSDGGIQLGVEYYRYFVLNDTNFQLADYDAHNLSIAEEINPGRFDAFQADLRPFAETPHYGKIIHYVGWADQLLTASASVYYYETVRNFTENHTTLKMEDFYRLFPVPGLLHCVGDTQGGKGATAFGATLDTRPPLAYDAEHNILSAIVRWVEDDVAPESFIAAAWNNGIASDGLNYTRPICKFPLTLRYKGSGDTNVAESFECVEIV